MPSEEIPITGAVVAWARTRAGMSLDDARRKFARIDEWEAGTAFPTYSQLELLATTFKLPVAAFFFPEPPQLPSIKESFRTLPDTEFDQMPRPVRFLLQKGKAFQLNLAELAGGKNPAERQITRDLSVSDDISAEDMAAAVRSYLGVSLEDQAEWADEDTALKNWRKAIQDVGVFVFKDAFHAEGYFGFSLYDDVFPIIYVNNSATKTRQCFTLFHELAHIVFKTSGIDESDDSYIGQLTDHQKRIEVLCNRFAGEFLLPEAAFVEVMKGRPRTEATAELLASTFKVSREVIFRKFLDHRWISQRDYTEAADRWRQQVRRGGSGGNFYNTKITYLGREYISLALSQYRRNRIDENQLAEYLDVKPKHVNTLEEYFAGAR